MPASNLRFLARPLQALTKLLLSGRGLNCRCLLLPPWRVVSRSYVPASSASPTNGPVDSAKTRLKTRGSGRSVTRPASAFKSGRQRLQLECPLRVILGRIERPRDVGSPPLSDHRADIAECLKRAMSGHGSVQKHAGPSCHCPHRSRATARTRISNWGWSKTLHVAPGEAVLACAQ
jgi:hypothetical protein